MNTLVLATLLSVLTTNPDNEGPDPRAELKTAVPYAIELLKNKDYQQFIEKFAHPDQLKRVLDQREMKRIVGDFSKEKSKTTLAAFMKIKDATPTMRDEGNEAVFLVDLPDSPIKEIVFVRTDGTWFLRNQSVSTTAKK